MGTRSTIGARKDGSYIFIFCHWDGYYEHNGKILYKHYQNPEKVKQLLNLGDLSTLGKNIGTKHDFNESPEDECNAYIRDRGETTKENYYQTVLESEVNDYLKEQWDREFLYIYDYDTNEWLANEHTSIKKLKPLKDILEELDDE